MAEDVAAVVVDASAIVELVARTPLRTAVATRLEGADLHAPHLLDAEVLSAVGRLRRSDALDDGRAGRAVRDLASAPLTRHDLAPLLEGAWARRSSLRLTDALYVELAERLAVPLVTTDLRLARATAVADAVT